MAEHAPGDGLELYRLNGPPEHDLAFESWLLERASAGACCLALASWKGPLVVLGYGQAAGQVDLEWCRENGVAVLRRISGGTGVVHANDLALSLAVPATHPWARGIIALYRRFLAPLAAALERLGARVEPVGEHRRAPGRGRPRSPVCFEDRLAETLLVDGRKAVGCAQARRRGAVLVHAAVLLGFDSDLYAGAFGAAGRGLETRVGAAVSDVSAEALGESVAGELAAALGAVVEETPRPALPAPLLERYRTPRWAPVASRI